MQVDRSRQTDEHRKKRGDMWRDWAKDQERKK